jgi:uncharacterized membrane protein YhaH (DUF805 family)
MDWKTLLFSFGGRINRGKYWAAVGLIIATAIAAGVVFGIFYAVAGETMGAIIGGLAGLAAALFSMWAGFAIMVKRLHDREKSAWWLVPFWAVPFILSLLAQYFGGTGLVLSLASLAISIWAFVEIACLKGTTGSNAYGPDPLPAEPD